MKKLARLLITTTSAIGVGAHAANVTIAGVWKDPSGPGLDFVIEKSGGGYSVVWKNQGLTYEIFATGDNFFTYRLDQGLQQTIGTCVLGSDEDRLVCRAKFLVEGQPTGTSDEWIYTRKR